MRGKTVQKFASHKIMHDKIWSSHLTSFSQMKESTFFKQLAFMKENLRWNFLAWVCLSAWWFRKNNQYHSHANEKTCLHLTNSTSTPSFPPCRSLHIVWWTYAINQRICQNPHPIISLTVLRQKDRSHYFRAQLINSIFVGGGTRTHSSGWVTCPLYSTGRKSIATTKWKCKINALLPGNLHLSACSCNLELSNYRIHLHNLVPPFTFSSGMHAARLIIRALANQLLAQLCLQGPIKLDTCNRDKFVMCCRN